MKTNHIIFLLFSVFTLSACSDFLDTMSESKQTDEATFAKTSFTEAAIMGIYSSLMDSYVYGQKSQQTGLLIQILKAVVFRQQMPIFVILHLITVLPIFIVLLIIEM